MVGPLPGAGLAPPLLPPVPPAGSAAANATCSRRRHNYAPIMLLTINAPLPDSLCSAVQRATSVTGGTRCWRASSSSHGSEPPHMPPEIAH